MKLRTIVRIAVASSVVLLCTGFALYSFFRLSSAENQKDFNLYSLVPTSASAILATDDAAELVAEVDGLTCSQNQQYLHVSKLFSYLKQYLYTISEDAPHGLSRQMNQVLISFHEPDNDRNQVLYCSLGSGDRDLIERFVRKYVSSDYPSKTFNYKGENINIYPLASGDFLSCYLTPDFMVLSYQKKLIEEVIDAEKSEKSLATDSVFMAMNRPKKSTSSATIFTRLDGMIGWTEFDMKLKDDFIYFSGISHDVDTCFSFINVLRQQKAVSGFPGEMLPSTAFYFSKQGIEDWSSLLSFAKLHEDVKKEKADDVQERDKQLARYLIENTGHELIACLFLREDTLQGSAAVMSLSVADVPGAEGMLRSLVDMPTSFCYTPKKAYSIYSLPYTNLFSQLTNFAGVTSHIYATFYGGHLLLAPDADSLSSYIRQLEAGKVLNGALAYQAGTDGLSDSYHFMLMADFEQIFQQPENYVHIVPEFFFRNATFFQNFILFAQLTCADGVIYPNIVLKYKSENQ